MPTTRDFVFVVNVTVAFEVGVATGAASSLEHTVVFGLKSKLCSSRGNFHALTRFILVGELRFIKVPCEVAVHSENTFQTVVVARRNDEVFTLKRELAVNLDVLEITGALNRVNNANGERSLKNDGLEVVLRFLAVHEVLQIEREIDAQVYGVKERNIGN